MYSTIAAPNKVHHLLIVPPMNIARFRMVTDNKIMSVIGYNRSVIVEATGCVSANSERITNPIMIAEEIAMRNEQMTSLRSVRAE